MFKRSDSGSGLKVTVTGEKLELQAESQSYSWVDSQNPNRSAQNKCLNRATLYRECPSIAFLNPAKHLYLKLLHVQKWWSVGVRSSHPHSYFSTPLYDLRGAIPFPSCIGLWLAVQIQRTCALAFPVVSFCHPCETGWQLPFPRGLQKEHC